MFSTFIGNWWVMHDFLQIILFQRFIIQVGYIHDDFKSNEMNNAVLNCVLISKHVNADTFTKKSAGNLAQSQNITDLRPMVHKKMRLIVCKLH